MAGRGSRTRARTRSGPVAVSRSWTLALCGALAVPGNPLSAARTAPSGVVLVRPAGRPDTVRVAAERLSLALDPASGGLRLDVRDEGGAVIHELGLPGLWLDGTPQRGFTAVASEAGPSLRNDALRVDLETLGGRSIAVTWSARDDAVHDFELRLRSRDETRYYGTGERFQALNQRGYILPLLSDDRYGNKGVGSHKPIPFFMSSEGFGVWVDSRAPGTLDLSGTHRHLTLLRFPERTFRVVFLPGPRMTQVLEEFTRLTGRPRVPPPWAFGLWKSRDVHHHADSAYADIRRLRELDIPASVLVLDSPWSTGYNDFVINQRQFPEPSRMFDEIRRLGFRTCLWLTPFLNLRSVQEVEGISDRSRNYLEAVENGHLVEGPDGEPLLVDWWKGTGGLVDFTDPEAVAWWHGELARTRAHGARCFKADDGEGNFVPEAVFHDGTPARLMKNRYSVLYAGAVQAYIDEHLAGDGVLLARSGHTGAQRYPFSWAGDNRGDFSFADGLPSVILAGQNAALSGLSLWGSDIAGYAGTPTAEVFLRWTQFATFTPLMQVHMTSNLGPWDFGEQALEVFRRFAILRIRLFPYIYDAVHEAARSGLPPIRPMALAFPDDPEASRHPYQFLFGPDLLVAPVHRAETSRPVYLPAGTWYDYWTGTAHGGGRVLEVDAPIDRIPLFVRAGAILPLLPDDVRTLVRPDVSLDPDLVALDDRRVLEVWPGGPGTVATYDGLAARLGREGSAWTLRLSAETARPVEVRLVGRRVRPSETGGGRVLPTAAGAAGTRISFERLEGEVTVRWEEPGS